MKTRLKRAKVWPRALAACLFVATAGQGINALAETYPSRTIRMIVPFNAGGGIDALARQVGAKLSETLGQPVVVENLPGAAGNRASDLVARATPDGYTLLVGTNSMAINPALPGSRAPDPVRAFAPVSKLVTIPVVVAVTPSFEAQSLQELLALARKTPRKLAFANQGIGTTSHIAAALLSQRAGVEFLHVPYSGTGSVARDVISGEIPILFSATGVVAPLVRGGQLRALAVTGSQRSSALPEVPTVAEAGLPGFEVSSWYGVLAPAGTPAGIVGRLHAELVRILALPDVSERLSRQGMHAIGNTPAQFGAEIGADVERWARVVREARIGVE
ncbi:MAG: tripartite tricarboxylate transporter substrate binding protein [Burkholderiales bacterium]|nr:tripartite tricarboxylate transporter substrate binding protein [Burkholderiales bacterium]